MTKSMSQVSAFEESVIEVLEETRSVTDTAEHLGVPLREVQRVAMMAFGLGLLDCPLSDY